MTRIAINGFGRIGRQAYKVALEKNNIEVVAINDLAPVEVSKHLLKYDSVYNTYEKTIEILNESEKTFLVVDGKKTEMIMISDPEKLPWKDMSIDVVLECTGRFEEDRASYAHIRAGAKRVVISAPAKGEGNVPTFLIGVNDQNYSNDEIVSNASCTTNNVGPVTKVILEKFGIKKAAITTIHSYTATQNLVDGFTKASGDDLRRSRAAAQNIVPSTTGAAISTTETLPQLKGKFDGMSVRVPTICGSLTDFTFLLERSTTKEEVKNAFIEASKDPRCKGVLEVTSDPIVSTDIIGKTASAIVDLELIKVIDGDLLKVLAWYDNEMGYSNRLIEMALVVGNSLH